MHAIIGVCMYMFVFYCVYVFVCVWIWSLVFDTPMSQILALCLDFEIAKNIYVLLVLIWAFGGCWRFLTFVWNIDLDLDMAPGLIGGVTFILGQKIQRGSPLAKKYFL